MTDTPSQPDTKRPFSFLKQAGWFLFFTTVFTTAYCQAPLYYSNQHQYFLHGLADGGYGSLDQDWLANTKDPTPIFSFLVYVTYRFGDVRLFHVWYALLMGIYCISMVGLFTHFARKPVSVTARIAFFAVFLLVHSALVRCVSARLWGVDYPWYLQAGVAGQYVLGPMLQPSCFGVLLILSLCAFANEKPLLAVSCSALGAIVHTTYLPAAAMLTASYMVVLLFERQVIKSLLTGAASLLLVMPIVIYNFTTFGPSSTENFADAQNVLVHFRIPHHAIPRLWSDISFGKGASSSLFFSIEFGAATTCWIAGNMVRFDTAAAFQILWMVLGIALSYGSRLFPVLGTTFLIGACLTIVQIITDNNTLALLFPWRISVVLVPVAAVVILSRIISLIALLIRLLGPKSRDIPAVWQRALVWAPSICLIGVVVIAGLIISVNGMAFQTRDEELQMMDFVRKNRSPGDVYLLPIRVPNLEKTVHGSKKSDFRPLKKLQGDNQFIPINLQRFRLCTGVPIFVDFKSIPYWDKEVLQWRERLALNEQICTHLKSARKEDQDKAIGTMQKHAITHIVFAANEQAPKNANLKLVYEDRWYRVFRLTVGD